MEPKKLERKVIQEKMKGYDSKRKKTKNKKHEDDTRKKRPVQTR